jgi:prefoldin alpha subunit
MSAPAASGNARAPTVIKLDEMSLDQLNNIKQSESARMQNLSQRYAQLRAAEARLFASRHAVYDLETHQTPNDDSSNSSNGEQQGKEVLIPLTDSVFVPGRIRPSKMLLVELGTGYYADKSFAETINFLNRKLKLVESNTENIAKALEATKQNIDAVTTTMQGKMLEIRAVSDDAIVVVIISMFFFLIVQSQLTQFLFSLASRRNAASSSSRRRDIESKLVHK